MSSYKTRVETAAAGFSTLIVMVPWKVLEALGQDEDAAACTAAAFQATLGVAAVALGRSAWARARSFHIAAVDETFHFSSYLRDFGMFVAAELLIFVGLALALQLHLL